MDIILPLDKMTVAEKLRLMDAIWEDLLRTSAELPPPNWHEDVLRAREAKVREGISSFSDWSEAQDWIRRRTRT